MDFHQLQRADRYESRKERVRSIADRMHHLLAANCCLDSLDAAIRALEGVALRGERLALAHAQAARRAPPAAEEGEADDAEGGARRRVTADGAGGEGAGPADGVAGDALRPDAPGEEHPAAPSGEEAPPAADGPAELTVKQKPPVAKPGRTRGWAPGSAKAKAKPAKPKPRPRNKPNRPEAGNAA